MSWLKIEKNIELEFRIVSTHFVRLTSQQVGVPKPFQDCRFSLRSKRLPSELGVPKPFQQNAAHFVGFFNARQLT
jgi:hypothetical protein